MKYWTHLIIIIALGYFLGQWLPWWMISIVAIMSAFLLKHKFGLSVMFGFLAGFVLWAGFSLYLDVENQSILSPKIGLLFGGLSSTAVIAVTGLIGGLIVAMGSAVGAAIREVVPNYITE
ncbi:hypothetical protein [Portibacter lacus]|uniref:Uncharacterized protein n=1 Tax=Portibacter lacus TaxID=1099794 RepID=A0AA37SJI5_9BACT|nr:hypothetical protein [Portibacter lacus]GLR15781.1 hypothetical protein GCM10007940_03960 [Portibacter lacus]